MGPLIRSVIIVYLFFCEFRNFSCQNMKFNSQSSQPPLCVCEVHILMRNFVAPRKRVFPSISNISLCCLRSPCDFILLSLKLFYDFEFSRFPFLTLMVLGELSSSTAAGNAVKFFSHGEMENFYISQECSRMANNNRFKSNYLQNPSINVYFIDIFSSDSPRKG